MAETVTIRAQRCASCSANIDMRPETEIEDSLNCAQCEGVPGRYRDFDAAYENNSSPEEEATRPTCMNCGSTQFVAIDRTYSSTDPGDTSIWFPSGASSTDYECTGCGRDPSRDYIIDWT